MPTGDDALAAGMDIVDGASTLAADIDEELNLTRDYIAQRTHDIVPVASGGTGATTPVGAIQAIHGVQSVSAPLHNIGLRWTGTRIEMTVNGTYVGLIANTDDL